MYYSCFSRFPQYFNKKTEFTMIFFVTGCGNAQNMGTESTISGLSGSCVSFLCSAGRSLGLPSSKQTPRLRPLQGESWGLLGYDQEELCRKWADAFMALNAKLPKRLPCQCRVSSKSTELRAPIILSMTQKQHLCSLLVIPPYFCFITQL